jgi:dynein heavy chain
MAKLDIGHKDGHWVMLQNVHLMPSFLLDLEKKLDLFAAEGSNPTFRLFISSDPNKAIPIGLLDKSIKLTNEPPMGVKQNLKRAFTFFNKEEIEDKDPKVKTILFALCYFHTVMSERRKFGAKGWNMKYPFNMEILEIQLLSLTTILRTTLLQVKYHGMILSISSERSCTVVILLMIGIESFVLPILINS